MSNHGASAQSSSWGYPLTMLLVMALLLVFSLNTSLQRAVSTSTQRAVAQAHELLLQMAVNQPNERVAVIVQKTVTDDSVEKTVAQLDGVVTKDLHIINGFVAELPAKAIPQLAKTPGVRWVSPDAAVTDSAVGTVYTAWATGIGSVMPNGFTNAAAMVDSPLGPNGTFANGDKVSGSFTGFDVEDTPGNAVTKVEVLLRAYVPDRRLNHDVKLSVYLAGQKIKDYPIRDDTFKAYAGTSANAGTISLDITNARAWKWADFDSGLELVINQSGFDQNDTIYYDAIGLRVTSAPGIDTSLAANVTALPKGAISLSKLANVYDRAVRAPDVWNQTPALLQGQGLTVAVIDSGVFKAKDIDKRLIAKVNFNREYHDSSDRYGHGTFVAGIVGGDGSASGGMYIGIAPKTNLINVRISNDKGMASESDLISAMQWVNDNRAKYNIRVLNLSLNSSVAQSYHTSPTDAAAEILWFNGIVVVVSAGNNGTDTLYPPANDPFVITVGASDDRGTASLADDIVAPFSAWGQSEDGTAKPDLVAPGVNIIATLPYNNQLVISRDHPTYRVNDNYFRMSGTSMSAPMVSGAVALLLQDEPRLNPDQVKYRLKATAAKDSKKWPGYDATRAGTGYLDIYAAVHGKSQEHANTGIQASKLLWSGNTPVTWSSVNWGSVNWGSVNWGSVNWGSVNWGSVNWGSNVWDK